MCENLLQEGRALAKSGKGGLAIEGTKGVGSGKREDVLQLWNCMRFTWDALWEQVDPRPESGHVE